MNHNWKIYNENISHCINCKLAININQYEKIYVFNSSPDSFVRFKKFSELPTCDEVIIKDIIE